jgi:septin family protein
LNGENFPIWIPKRAKVRILELSSITKKKLFERDKSNAINHEKNVEIDLLKEKKLNTLQFDGSEDVFTKKVDVRKAWEKKVKDDKKKLIDKVLKSKKKLEDAICKIHNIHISSKIENIRRFLDYFKV